MDRKTERKLINEILDLAKYMLTQGTCVLDVHLGHVKIHLNSSTIELYDGDYYFRVAIYNKSNSSSTTIDYQKPMMWLFDLTYLRCKRLHSKLLRNPADERLKKQIEEYNKSVAEVKELIAAEKFEEEVLLGPPNTGDKT